jgi:hypothetical protein
MLALQVHSPWEGQSNLAQPVLVGSTFQGLQEHVQDAGQHALLGSTKAGYVEERLTGNAQPAVLKRTWQQVLQRAQRAGQPALQAIMRALPALPPATDFALNVMLGSTLQLQPISCAPHALWELSQHLADSLRALFVGLGDTRSHHPPAKTVLLGRSGTCKTQGRRCAIPVPQASLPPRGRAPAPTAVKGQLPWLGWARVWTVQLGSMPTLAQIHAIAAQQASIRTCS